MQETKQHIPAVIQAGINRNYEGSLGSIDINIDKHQEEAFIQEVNHTIVTIDAGEELEVWVSFGGCLEIEMLRQHGIDADQINYKVIDRTPVGYSQDNDLLVLGNK